MIGKLESISAVCHHLGFFNNVGISAHYKLSDLRALELEQDIHQIVYGAVAGVVQKHAILSAIPVDEDTPNPYFARLESIDLKQTVSFVRRNKYHPDSYTEEIRVDPELDELLELQHNTNFKSSYGTAPFWRLIILQDESKQKTVTSDDHHRKEPISFTAIFIYHHALCDGVSGLDFQASFREALDATITSPKLSSNAIITTRQNALLPPIEELHPLPTNPNAHAPPVTANQWTGNAIQIPIKSRFKSLSLSPDLSTTFIQRCKAHGVTVTAALPPLIAIALYNILPADIKSLNTNIAVSLRRWLPQEVVSGALGNWFDAFQVRSFRSDLYENDPHDIWPLAAKTLNAITEYLNASPNGGPYTSIGHFKAIPDLGTIFDSLIGGQRDSAVEISNLGVFPPSKNERSLWTVGDVVLSRSAVVFGSAITVGAVLGGNGALSLSFTWQEGVIEEDIVDEVINQVTRFFRALEKENSAG